MKSTLVKRILCIGMSLILLFANGSFADIDYFDISLEFVDEMAEVTEVVESPSEATSVNETTEPLLLGTPNGIEITTLEGLSSAAANGGEYYLGDSIEGAAITVSASAGFVLDLNGKTITGIDGQTVFTVESGKSLTIKDSTGGGKITKADTATRPDYGGAINNAGTFTLDGGSIINCAADVAGGGVYNTGTFAMTGGTISGCDVFNANNGGGVYNIGTFSMSGGSISGCNVYHGNGNGGGVFNKGTFNFSGTALITGCRANYGGGVYNNEGSFTMSGGSITQCWVNTSGGGVANASVFLMSGGIITECNAGSGGGVFNNAQYNGFKISGNAVIEGNIKRHSYGENVYLCGSKTITQMGDFTGSISFHYEWAITDGSTVLGVTNSSEYTGTENFINEDGDHVGKINGSNLIWVEGYKVAFDANGHGVAPTKKGVIAGEKVIEPAEPTEEGYTFGGWFTESTCGNEYDFDTPVTTDLDLFAKWTLNSHKVSYEYTGAVPASAPATPSEVVKNYGASVGVENDPAAITGYVFDGWSTLDAEVTSGTFTMPDNDVVFTGNWTANTNTSYSVKHYQQNLDDDLYTLSDTDDKTGTTGQETDAQSKTYTGFTAKPFSQQTIDGDGTTVVEILYDRNTYTVTWKDGDTVIDTTTGVKYEKKLTEPTTPVKSGFSFEGWYKDAACENAWSFDTDTIASDKEIYSKWTELIDPPVAVAGLSYTGSEQTGVSEGTGYTISDNKGTDAGTYVAFARLVLGYRWADLTLDNRTINWEIERVDISAAVISEICDQQYTGSEIKPEPPVYIGARSLVMGTDFEYSYSDNTEPGDDARVTVTGIGNYYGSADRMFKICQEVVPVEEDADDSDDNGTYDANITGGNVDAVYGEWIQDPMTGNWSLWISGKKAVSTWVKAYNPFARGSLPKINWFYFNDEGVMLTGWQWIKDRDDVIRCYYLNPVSDGMLGACFLNGITPDRYTVDRNGAWLVNGRVQTK